MTGLRVAFSLLILVTGPAAAQSADLLNRLDPETAAAVEAILREAESDGLPPAPLRNKAFEGASKGADRARIVETVRRMHQRMRRAAAALGGASPAELVAAVSAIDLGVPDSGIAALRRARPDGSVAGALVGLAFLVQRGAPVDRSVAVVRTLLSARASDADFTRFRRLVEEDLRAGAPAAGAAEARARAYIPRDGMPPRSTP